MNEILINDDFWGQFYCAVIPGGGTLTAEWKSGEIETDSGSVFMFDRWYGLTGTVPARRPENRRNKCVRIYSDDAITVFGLEAAWTYWVYDRYGQVRIDTSRCPALQELTCAKVLSLDVSKNINLEMLTVHYSDLKELDLSHNGKLTRLEIHHCDNLLALDLTACPKLKHLVLRSCPSLHTLILNDNSELDYVSYNYDTAIAGESEDRLLETIGRNGGRVEKFYVGD